MTHQSKIHQSNQKWMHFVNWLIKWFKDQVQLTLSWWRPLSYRNQSIDLRSKSMDCFLYDNGIRHERIKEFFSYFVFYAFALSKLCKLCKLCKFIHCLHSLLLVKKKFPKFLWETLISSIEQGGIFSLKMQICRYCWCRET